MLDMWKKCIGHKMCFIFPTVFLKHHCSDKYLVSYTQDACRNKRGFSCKLSLQLFDLNRNWTQQFFIHFIKIALFSLKLFHTHILDGVILIGTLQECEHI
jgi:hypothetical protein